jgi:hypothetical protein
MGESPNEVPVKGRFNQATVSGNNPGIQGYKRA